MHTIWDYDSVIFYQTSTYNVKRNKKGLKRLGHLNNFSDRVMDFGPNDISSSHKCGGE